MAQGSEFELPNGQEISLFHTVQIGFGAHLACCSMGTGGIIPRGKRQGREADHSPQENVGPYIHSSICLHSLMLS
jgi:hypothetical protein